MVTPGMFFGERAILSDEPRTATVTVSEDESAKVLAISRQAFNMAVGTLSEINKMYSRSYVEAALNTGVPIQRRPCIDASLNTGVPMERRP